MNLLRVLACCGLVASLSAEPAHAQRHLSWNGPPPQLALGQRVRVSTWAPGFPTFGTSPFGVTRPVRFTGMLVAYSPLDSVRVARTAFFAQLSASPDRTVYWSDISRIDVPNGRNTLEGAAGGLGGAFGVALLVSLIGHVFGCNYSDNCPNIWKTTAQVSLVTVPGGAVYGFFSTRWKRVY